MSIEVRYATDGNRWNDLVEHSRQGTPFHLWEFCERAAEAAGAEFLPFVGYKGQEPVGVFPAYAVTKGPETAIVSPPPDLKISYQGPALVNVEKLSQRKRERRHRGFVDGVLERLDTEFDSSYIHVRSAPQYDDPRPFVWQSFGIKPSFTYVVDLTPDEEQLLSAFSSDARRNVTKSHQRVDITEGGSTAAYRIVEQVHDRHAEMGKAFNVPRGFVPGLVDSLTDGSVRAYVCTVDGAFAGGIVASELGDTVYRWLGGVKPDYDVPANDLLDWYVMRDAKARGVTRYDLVGAQEPRLCDYKAKFAPDLATYYELERGTMLMRFAVRLYQRFTK